MALLLWLGHSLVTGDYYAALGTRSHAALVRALLLAALWNALRREENALAEAAESRPLEVVAVESAPPCRPGQERCRP